jgi:DNA mismatch repair ATPase MutS
MLCREISGRNGCQYLLLTEQQVAIIKDGRHPLQRATHFYIYTNDTVIHNSNRLHLITGANYSGRDVYMSGIYL